MQIFSCHKCRQVLFFENVACARCGYKLAFLPDRGLVSGIDPAPHEAGLYVATVPAAKRARYRLCRNSDQHGVCNWAVPAEDDSPYCRACRLNDTIPNLSDAGALDAWHRLEIAKRRLFYSLDELGLPLESKAEHPLGLSFSFLRDGEVQKVATGHSDGHIVINIAEADDPFREKMRIELGETYRTLLGHFRHEIGHYYWYRLVQDQPAPLQRFRARFGDETADYAAAQSRHYQQGPQPNWPDHFVSAYASMHPWEDFAETWAHYLHMVDTLDTARAYGLSLRATPAVGSMVPLKVKARRIDLHSFEDLLQGWIPLTLALNSLNRSMGTADSYPFVLPAPAIEKLRFCHDLMLEAAEAHEAAAAAAGR